MSTAEQVLNILSHNNNNNNMILHILPALQCEEGDLRLTGSSAINQGTVEICKNEIWGTICYSNWGQSEANVACRQLGFSANGMSGSLTLYALVVMISIPLLQLIVYILRTHLVSQYTIAMSRVLVWNYSLLTASMTAPQATVSLRLVFNAILIFSVYYDCVFVHIIILLL